DRRAEHPVRTVLLGEALGRAVGATVQAVHVFAEHDDALVLLHAAVHDAGHGIHELHVAPAAPVVERVGDGESLELAGIAAHADVHETRVWPEFGTDAALAFRVGVGFEQLSHSRGHRGLSLLPHGGDAGLVDQAELHHLLRHAVEGVAGTPGGLLLLV